MTDDYDWMDKLQRAANRKIDSLLPFEPAREMERETDIAAPPDEPQLKDIEQEVEQDLYGIDHDPFGLEGGDD